MFLNKVHFLLLNISKELLKKNKSLKSFFFVETGSQIMCMCLLMHM